MQGSFVATPMLLGHFCSETVLAELTLKAACTFFLIAIALGVLR